MGCDSDSLIGPRRTIKAAYSEEYPGHLIKRGCDICVSHSEKSNQILQYFYFINGAGGVLKNALVSVQVWMMEPLLFD